MSTILEGFTAPAGAISSKFVYEYVFSTLPISKIDSYIIPAFKSLLISTYETLRALLLVVFYLILIVAKLLILAFPHAMKLWQVVYDFHRTQLSTSDLIIEFTAITLLLIILIFRKRILRLWNTIEAYISAKSKAAARAAPHVLFFTSAFILAVVGRKFILPLTSSYSMPIFTLVIPWINTLWLERKAQQSTDVDRKLLDKSSQQMVLWTVLAIYHALVTLLSIIPFSSKILKYLPYLKEIVIVILIWTQLSPVFTDIVYTSLISPVMVKLSTYIPTARSVESHQHRASSMISMFKMMRILNDNQVRILQAVLQDGVVSAMGLVFIILPNPFAHIGMVCIALLLPAYRTVSVTNMIRNHLHGPRTASTGNHPKVSLEFLHQQANQWIHYWICVGFLWLLRIYATTIWPSIIIAVTLWLQHTYFSGASKTIATTYSSLCLMAERNRQAQEQRRLEKQRKLKEAEEQRRRQPADEVNPTSQSDATLPNDIAEEVQQRIADVEHVDATSSDEGDFVQVDQERERSISPEAKDSDHTGEAIEAKQVRASPDVEAKISPDVMLMKKRSKQD